MLAFAWVPLFVIFSTNHIVTSTFDCCHLALVTAYIAQRLAILGIMAILYFAGAPMTAVTTMSAVAAAIWTMAIVQYVLVNRRLARKIEPEPRRYDVATWVRTAMPLL